jgi:hypothetical protein
MKIVFDNPSEEIDQHARLLHRKMMQKHELPRITGVTRALVPTWCDECSERAWGPVLGGPVMCPACTEKQNKNKPGFGT